MRTKYKRVAVKIYLQNGVVAYLRKKAKENGRSYNREIEMRITESIERATLVSDLQVVVRQELEEALNAKP